MMIAILFLSVLTLTLLGFKSSKDLASSVDCRSIVTLIVFSVLLFHLSIATVALSASVFSLRRSFQAVFITSGSKSRAARSDRVGLLWVVSVGLASVTGVGSPEW